MFWKVIAEGTPEEFGNSIPAMTSVPSGTKLRLEMETKLPIAPLFNLWGAEWVIQYMIDTSGAEIVEVESTGWNKIVVHMIAHSPVIPIIYGIIVVLSIAGLAYIMRELRLLAEIAGPVASSVLIFAVVAAAGFFGYSVFKSGVLDRISYKGGVLT